ncbi:MAG: DNA alkylation repair protein [Thermoplasmatota archaeon]
MNLVPLLAAIEEQAEPERAEKDKAYLKSELEHMGASVPVLRKLAKRWLKEHPELKTNPWPLVDAAWGQGIWELRSFCSFLLEHVSAEALDEERLKALVRNSHSWALVDQIAIKVLGRIHIHMESWIEDEDVWVRRAGLLWPLLHFRTLRGDWVRWKSAAATLLDDESFWIRKAIGWVLREIVKKEPHLVVEFCNQHGARMSKLSYREATRNLLPAEGAQLTQFH